MNVLSLFNGSFELRPEEGGVFLTASPEEMFEHIVKHDITSWEYSTAFNHPKDYGMDVNTVMRFCGMIDAYLVQVKARLVEKREEYTSADAAAALCALIVRHKEREEKTMYFITIDEDHRFAVTHKDHNYATVLTRSPRELFDELVLNGITSWNESARLDFPEEYGMPQKSVDEFRRLSKHYQKKQEGKTLTPVVFRVQKLSSARPAFPKLSCERMTAYRKEQPCDGAVWKRKDQWWQLRLDSLLDLVELGKKVGHGITIELGGVLVINDLPLSIDDGSGVC